MNKKQSILFVCTGNAGRSQIAEVLFRSKYSDAFNVYSAGVDPWINIHPVGRALMEDNGYSMEGRKPKHVQSIDFNDIDIVVTIGAPAERGTRELRLNKNHIHWDVDDPAGADGTLDSESVFAETKRRIENKMKMLIPKLANIQNIKDYYWQPGIASAFFRDDNIKYSFSPIKHIPMLAEKGFKLLELTCYVPDYDFPWMDTDSVKELIHVCADYGIKIWSAHPPENEILLGTDAAARHKNLDMLRKFADFCNTIGAALMPIHFWSQTRTLNEARNDLILDFLISELESISYDSNVTLCLETLRSNVSKVSNFDLLNIAQQSHNSQLGFLVDSGHSKISGDMHNSIIQAGKLLKSLHLHDNDGVNDLHQIPGKGIINWSLLANDLKTVNYSGPIMYEVSYISEKDHNTALKSIMDNYMTYFSKK